MVSLICLEPLPRIRSVLRVVLALFNCSTKLNFEGAQETLPAPIETLLYQSCHSLVRLPSRAIMSSRTFLNWSPSAASTILSGTKGSLGVNSFCKLTGCLERLIASSKEGAVALSLLAAAIEPRSARTTSLASSIVLVAAPNCERRRGLLERATTGLDNNSNGSFFLYISRM